MFPISICPMLLKAHTASTKLEKINEMKKRWTKLICIPNVLTDFVVIGCGSSNEIEQAAQQEFRFFLGQCFCFAPFIFWLIVLLRAVRPYRRLLQGSNSSLLDRRHAVRRKHAPRYKHGKVAPPYLHRA